MSAKQALQTAILKSELTKKELAQFYVSLKKFWGEYIFDVPNNLQVTEKNYADLWERAYPHEPSSDKL